MGDKSKIDSECDEFDTSTSDNEEEEVNINKKSSGLKNKLTLDELDVIIRYLCQKKRGSYPTTMLKSLKKAAHHNDMEELRIAGGPAFTNSRYLPNFVITTFSQKNMKVVRYHREAH